MINLKCLTCGDSREFPDQVCAKHAGWTTPPTADLVTCFLCNRKHRVAVEASLRKPGPGQETDVSQVTAMLALAKIPYKQSDFGEDGSWVAVEGGYSGFSTQFSFNRYGMLEKIGAYE